MALGEGERMRLIGSHAGHDAMVLLGQDTQRRGKVIRHQADGCDAPAQRWSLVHHPVAPFEDPLRVGLGGGKPIDVQLAWSVSPHIVVTNIAANESESAPAAIRLA